MHDPTQSEEKNEGHVAIWHGYPTGDLLVSPGPLLSRTVHSVAVGDKHIIFLTTGHKVYSQGDNSFGQLGIGTIGGECKETSLIKTFEGQDVCYISCGSNHSGAVTGDGHVFCWGTSKSGQCGSGQATAVPLPTKVEIKEPGGICVHGIQGQNREVCMLQVACGDTHTLALSNSGEIWVWGAGCQLGLNTEKECLVPQRLDFLHDRFVIQVSAGAEHSVALIKKSSDKKTKIVSNAPETPLVKPVVHPITPSTCPMCEKEIYSMKEEGDTCIISDDHKCPLGLALDSEKADRVSESGSEPPKRLENEFMDSVWVLRNGDKAPSTSPSTAIATAVSYTETVPSNKEATCDTKVVWEVQNYEENASPKAQEKQNTTTTQDSAADNHQEEDQGSTKVKSASEKTEAFTQSVALEQEKNSSSPTIPDTTAESESGKQDVEMVRRRSGAFIDEQFSPSGSSIPKQSLFPHAMDKETDDVFCETPEREVHRSRSSFLGDVNGARQYLSRTLSLEQSLSDADSPLKKDVEPSPEKGNALKSQRKSVSTTIANFAFVSHFNIELEDSFEAGGSTDSLQNSLEDQSNRSSSRSSTSNEGSPSSGAKLVRRASDFIGTSQSWTAAEYKNQRGMRHSLSLDFKKSGEEFTRWKKLSQPVWEARKRQNTEVYLETEVWTWGRGKKGQLGHGDMLNRNQPCCIKSLSTKKVMKVSAGSYHTLAVLSTGQVLSWGSNSHGQLGRTENEYSPGKVKVLSKVHLWDGASGREHSLFLADCLGGGPPEVYYSGRRPDVQESSTMVAQPIKLNVVRKCGWVRHLAAGGLSVAVFNRNTSNHLAALHELASTERTFFHHMALIASGVLKHILMSEPFASEEIHSSELSMKVLFDAFTGLSSVIGMNSVGLTRAVQGSLSVNEVFMLRQQDQLLSTLQHYSKSFGDAVAIGAFDWSSKVVSTVFKEKNIRDVVTDILEEINCEKNLSDVKTLMKLLQLPLRRLKEYERLAQNLALCYPDHSMESDHLFQLSSSCGQLKQAAIADHNLADNTRKFWDLISSKMPKFNMRQLQVDFGSSYLRGHNVDALKQPGRRLLRESRAHPLHVANASRFSLNWLLLFNDALVFAQYSSHQAFPLATIWLEAVCDSDTIKNAFTLIMPEESLTVYAPSAQEKTEWQQAFHQAIEAVLSDRKSGSTFSQTLQRKSTVSARSTLPLSRYATHVFYKPGHLKDAKYIGMWHAGKMHGQGEITWSNGQKYVGKLKNGVQHGHGVLSIPKDDKRRELQDGNWKEGKLNGLGSIKYASEDVYEGYFKDGQRHGHGVLKTGKLTASTASVYIGEWAADKRCGYGVFDDIVKGEKYMGMWHDDLCSGSGVLVTLDGLYYEGNWIQNRLSGVGLMITEDNIWYEGEFYGSSLLYGKGTMTLPNSDKFVGSFNGAFTDGVKISGNFYKAINLERRSVQQQPSVSNPESFGKHSVPADQKWKQIFSLCESLLGGPTAPATKAWEAVAVMVSAGKRTVKKDKARYRSGSSDDLEKIPPYNRGTMTIDYYKQIQEYLRKAFEVCFHPLGKLMEGLVDVFRATYVGVGAHSRLLHHARDEVNSFVKRTYNIIRMLFPDLPSSSRPMYIHHTDCPSPVSEEEDDKGEVITPSSLLHPLLLPKIYPPLFTLYALHNEKEDEKYWDRLQRFNKQGDVALLAYLGVDQKFWLIDESLLLEKRQKLQSIKDKCYSEAVETLQQISTSFGPADKLDVIKKTFDEVNKAVQNNLGCEYMWCMDDLFPVFMYVVVRARIRHLGAEIHFVDDLMEGHLEHGELGLMFTTLRACYFQIQHEKMN
ncbi:alsin [Lingula anatina]|uniref:Alsin n=1 Tax=Lingula anatina TaxID=7574 RepID=A0A2R2MTE0_LINAN|nr:alsin [Lingula anatina]|eukprot:XP_023933292.1 alsin [Lingula anatina]